MVNLFSGTRWFSREALELMVECLQAMEIFGHAARRLSPSPGARRRDWLSLGAVPGRAGAGPPVAPTSPP